MTTTSVLGLVGGFLGAGKTTLLTAVAAQLRRDGRRVVIITNDQGDELLDTETARRTDVPVREVTGGCFCCRFDDLAESIKLLMAEHHPDVVLAEAVGSCTDLAATVVRPLQASFGPRLHIAPLLVAVDPQRLVALGTADLDRDGLELGWLLHSQLEEADLLVATKADLANSDGHRAALAQVAADYPGKPMTRLSALRGEDVAELVEDWLFHGGDAGSRPLEIDYERYADAEALLSWADRRMELTAQNGGFDLNAWAAGVLARIDEALTEQGALIGHVKLSVGDGAARAKGSLVGFGRWQLDDRHPGRPVQAIALLNARVRQGLETLPGTIDQAIRDVSAAHQVQVTPIAQTDLIPGRPEPTHRIPLPS